MFDEEKAKRVKKFIERQKHSKGIYTGTHFILQEWQYNKIIKSLYRTLNSEGFLNWFH